jgi:uncharacterized protein YbjT (DUF2867 family)
MQETQDGLRLLIAGSSGAVGQQVLRLALADPRISRVIAPGRRAQPMQHPKLESPQVDFSALDPRAAWWSVDAVVCALGTTMRIAGSRAAFSAIDRDLPIAMAQLAQAAGATRFALNSSLGARLSGNFYLRTKAEAEEGIRALGFRSLTIVRPSLIDAQRAAPRRGEQLGLCLARCLGPLIPRSYRPVKAEAIARALLDGVLRSLPGELIIASGQLHRD